MKSCLSRIHLGVMAMPRRQWFIDAEPEPVCHAMAFQLAQVSTKSEVPPAREAPRSKGTPAYDGLRQFLEWEETLPPLPRPSAPERQKSTNKKPQTKHK